MAKLGAGRKNFAYNKAITISIIGYCNDPK